MDSLLQQAITQAERLLNDSRSQMRRDEREDFARLQRMMQDPEGMAFTLEFVDRAFRSQNNARRAHALRTLLAKHGIPIFLKWHQRFLMATGATLSQALPDQIMPRVEKQMQRDSSRVILPAEPHALQRYLDRRLTQGMKLNINLLGEAVLGEEEANNRLQQTLALLDHPDIDYVSVKISTLFSQINILDREGSLQTLRERLRILYRKAASLDKFVNLDMEEYRDLDLTLAAFRETLDEEEFGQYSAGIVLQAYLPDSWNAQQELTEWALHRHATGGAPIKLRLVKGANLAMEKVEAAIQGWHPAPYPNKHDTDANYKRMLEYACIPRHAQAVHLGVASHNLFDLGMALVLRENNQLQNEVEIEMLEGMANHQARTVLKAANSLLLYSPIVKHSDFNNALAYLVRRLDENTQKENFLHDLFSLTPDSPAWEKQKQAFIAAWEHRKDVSAQSRRTTLPASPSTLSASPFRNSSNTDWTRTNNRNALQEALSQHQPPTPPAPDKLETCIQTANDFQQAWKDLGFEKRSQLLLKAADVIEQSRMETIACMVDEANKAPAEADIEVSEAADFARCYASYRPSESLAASPLGTIAIVPPWNFPYAIPCGGVLAALMAGNCVILKPAPEVRGIAWRLCQHLWHAGIPRQALQYFAADDDATGKALICHPDINAVVLTGAWNTARMFHSWRPNLLLFAETSGKNALIVTAQADRDLAVKDLVKSAFGHSGQKCSAASLCILEAEVYDDPDFLHKLRDAAQSLRVGPAENAASVVTPLIQEPTGKLLRAFTQLDEGETWLLEPKQDPRLPNLWSPGIRLGVQSGSWFHQTECFGPVLGIMRAPDLDTAIKWQNAVTYGLTAGIHSLDDDEIAHWKSKVQAGNAYINRGITGAVVLRQPFGGWKRSSIGPGFKAGHPDYLQQFLRLENHQTRDPVEDEELWSSTWQNHFLQEHDPIALDCESNILRYRPRKGMLLRIPSGDTHSINWAHLAARTSGVPLHVSKADEESEQSLLHRLPELTKQVDTFRSITTPGDDLLQAIHDYGLNWIQSPLLNHPHTELLCWTRQQAISETRHRYGLITRK